MHDTPVALVTGANRGLGFETARQLAAKGLFVLVGSRDLEQGRSAANEVGGNSKGFELDVSDSSSIGHAIQHIRNEYGRLDVLVNNAAILNDIGQQPSKVSEQTLRQNLDVNFIGPYLLTAGLADLLKAAPDGRVLNLGTQVGSFANLSDPDSPIKDDICPAYQASKIALNSMTALFAKEFADTNVRINSVCPGWVMTDMGHEDLPDYGDAVKPLSPAEAVAAYVDLVNPAQPAPQGKFITGGQAIPW